jgi:hypothetical protein
MPPPNRVLKSVLAKLEEMRNRLEINSFRRLPEARHLPGGTFRRENDRKSGGTNTEQFSALRVFQIASQNTSREAPFYLPPAPPLSIGQGGEARRDVSAARLAPRGALAAQFLGHLQRLDFPPSRPLTQHTRKPADLMFRINSNYCPEHDARRRSQVFRSAARSERFRSEMLSGGHATRLLSSKHRRFGVADRLAARLRPRGRVNSNT